jgi:hypothetical protein
MDGGRLVRDETATSIRSRNFRFASPFPDARRWLNEQPSTSGKGAGGLGYRGIPYPAESPAALRVTCSASAISITPVEDATS